MLYQLSYTHQKTTSCYGNCWLLSNQKMARQEGFEPSAYGLEVRCSIQLSYWRTTCGIYLKFYSSTRGCVSSMCHKHLQIKIKDPNYQNIGIISRSLIILRMADHRQKCHTEELRRPHSLDGYHPLVVGRGHHP